MLSFQRRLKSLNARFSEKANEHRAALITAAVTGQIDPATYRRSGTTDRALDRIAAEMAE